MSLSTLKLMPEYLKNVYLVLPNFKSNQHIYTGCGTAAQCNFSDM